MRTPREHSADYTRPRPGHLSSSDPYGLRRFRAREDPVGFANSSGSCDYGHPARFGALDVVSRRGCLLWSFAYLAVRNLFALVWLLARRRRSKELEILVLRHELAMLRRQTRQPKLTRADRTLLAALSRSLPRVAWADFSVKPETLLRWHPSAGRPPLDVYAPGSWSAATGVVAARTDPAARRREPALGIPTYRRRNSRV